MANETVRELATLSDEERSRRLRLQRERLMFEESLRTRNERLFGESIPQSFVASEETLRERAATAADPRIGPGIGIVKAVQDVGVGAQQIATQIPRPVIEGGIPIPHPIPTQAISIPRFSFKTNDEEFFRLAGQAEENQRIFDIIADRRPDVKNAELATQIALFATPFGRRTAPGITAPRQITATTEAIAGGSIAALQPSATPESLLTTTLGGTILGPVLFKVMTGVTSTGRFIVGGSPAAIRDSADLLAAEKNLGVSGLLTTGELRGGRPELHRARVMQQIEGVMDNIPVAFLGLSGKRRAQVEGFDNAVNQIRAAFPDIPEDEVVRLLQTSLNRRQEAVQEAYAQVAKLAPDAADNVNPANYIAEVDRQLGKELAKGANADQSVIRELENLAKQGPVDFQSATAIAGDQATKIRKAKRGALDPAATGLDAGRQKLLATAWYRDLDAWANQFPANSEIVRAWEAAKKQFTETVLPFQKRPIAPIFDLQGYDTYSLSKALLKPRQAARLQELDERGALGFLFVNDLMAKHTDNAGFLNLKNFVADLNKGRTQKAFTELKGAVPDESMLLLNSLVKLVEAAPRAFRKTPNILATTAGTGVAVGGSILASDTFGGEIATAAISLGAARFLLSTPAGRAILTTAARVPQKNRAQLAALGNRASQTFLRFAEIQGTDVDAAEEAARIAIQGLEERNIQVPSAFTPGFGQ